MRRSLISTSKFEKSYRKFVRRNNFIQTTIDDALKQLEEDAFEPNLSTHKLYGNLFGLFACSCGYDCRIVFSIQKGSDSKKEYIILRLVNRKTMRKNIKHNRQKIARYFFLFQRYNQCLLKMDN